MLENFCAENLRPCAGAVVNLKSFRESFIRTLRRKKRHAWTRIAFSRALWRLGYSTGYGTGNKSYIINVALDATVQPSTPLVLYGEGRLIRKLA